MDFDAFVQSLKNAPQTGLVMQNPGAGTSTILYCNDQRICYKRGKSPMAVKYSDLYEGYIQYAGKEMSTNDLKAMRPAVFDSKHNGHSCHCTFLMMVLHRMGLASAIQGKGVKGNPFLVKL
ncbi:hypothetical protein V8J88_19880 [Massilia sp. W12]|uniref:hypothetical protein n=1 Tax=Massilia sp. W12 TaxID=3126507 RepID=UPI0030CAE059